MNLLKVVTSFDCENIDVMRIPSFGEWNCVADGSEFSAESVDELAGHLGGGKKDGVVLKL